jgi:glycosyltransferase involved in cell wall biosynthesis
MNQPLVSICIPCYNASATIGETLDAVVNQTYKNLEIIISDDKSTDNTVEILKDYANLDSRIRLILNEKNADVVGNYNKAIESACGEYLKLQCADDLYTPDCIEKEVNIFLTYPDKKLVMVTSEKWIINQQGKRLFQKKFLGKGGWYDGMKAVKKSIRWGTNIFGEPGCPLVRTDVTQKEMIDVPKELTYASEWDWWCRILRHGNLWVIKEPLFLYRIVETSDSVKNQRWKQAKVSNRWVKEYVDKKIVKLSIVDKLLAYAASWMWCLARNIIYKFAN